MNMAINTNGVSMDVTTIAQLIKEVGVSAVLTGVGIVLLYKLWPYIIDILATSGERNEIVRNNTAAINNNTAVLETVMAGRDRTCEAVSKHDADSLGRETRLESKIEGLCSEIGKVRGEIGIIKDRLE